MYRNVSLAYKDNKIRFVPTKRKAPRFEERTKHPFIRRNEAKDVSRALISLYYPSECNATSVPVA